MGRDAMLVFCSVDPVGKTWACLSVCLSVCREQVPIGRGAQGSLRTTRC
jgi:hypothetical protein